MRTEPNIETALPTPETSVNQSTQPSESVDSEQTADSRPRKSEGSSPAIQGAPNVGSSSTQPTLNELMTSVHQAVDLEQWGEARLRLDEVLQLNPDSVAAKDLQEFVTRQLELQHQQDLGKRFVAAVRNEHWNDAIEIAKNLKTRNSEVLEQIQRSETLITAEQLADRLLANPQRLSRPSTQNEVSRLRNLTDNIDTGERIGKKLERLYEMSLLWTTPVLINLSSDGYTNVILRPGRNLGRFRSQKVQLMPGEYELIGRRDGFREVRRSLRLDPNAEPRNIEIKASERF